MRSLFAAAVAAFLILASAASASAAGGTLAFTQGGGGIFTVAAAGGTPSPVVIGGTLGAYSPNGGKLAYVYNGSVFVANATGGSSKKLASGIPTATALSAGGPPSWSPDGKQLAYSDGSFVYVVGATGGTVTKVRGATDGFVSNATHPVWSHNGKSLYYVAINQTVSVQDSVYQLYTIPAAGGSQATALNAAMTDSWTLEPFSLSISPSGRSLAVTLGVFGEHPSTVTAVGLLATTGGRVTALSNVSAAAFSPSGTQLCAQSAGGLVVTTLGGTIVSTPVAASTSPAACAWKP